MAATPTPPRVRADLPPAILLFVPDQNRPATLIEVGFGQRQRLISPQPGAPEHDDQAGETATVASSLSLAHDRDDLLDRGRVPNSLNDRAFPPHLNDQHLANRENPGQIALSTSPDTPRPSEPGTESERGARARLRGDQQQRGRLT
jgi:hypothetical protein